MFCIFKLDIYKPATEMHFISCFCKNKCVGKIHRVVLCHGVHGQFNYRCHCDKMFWCHFLCLFGNKIFMPLCSQQEFCSSKTVYLTRVPESQFCNIHCSLTHILVCKSSFPDLFGGNKLNWFKPGETRLSFIWEVI